MSDEPLVPEDLEFFVKIVQWSTYFIAIEFLLYIISKELTQEFNSLALFLALLFSSMYIYIAHSFMLYGVSPSLIGKITGFLSGSILVMMITMAFLVYKGGFIKFYDAVFMVSFFAVGIVNTAFVSWIGIKTTLNPRNKQ